MKRLTPLAWDRSCMRKPAELLDAHAPLLILDAASRRIQAGVWSPGQEPVWEESEEEAGLGWVQAVEGSLKRSGRCLKEIGAILFCEGPGSFLGIRTAAMAVRAWQAVLSPPPALFAYRSLEVAAAFLAASGRPPPFSVICDARRGAWHVASVAGAEEAPFLHLAGPEEVAALQGELWTPDSFRSWDPLPRPAQTFAYRLGPMLTSLREQPLLRACATPDAFGSQRATYQRWEARPHRKPSG